MRADNINIFLRRLLLTPLVLLGFASIIATGGSGSGSDDDEDDSPRDDQGSIVLSVAFVAVARGETASVRVDIEGLPEGVGVSGYSIDLSETVSRIDIQTANCPAGIGTPSCRDWTITPANDSIPGTYPMRISAAGGVIAAADLQISVIGDLPPAEAARVTSSRMVITDDGRLWATGGNGSGQAGVGFFNACTDVNNHHCLLPYRVNGFVQVGSASDWIDVATNETISIAVRADGSVWLWGSNPGGTLGFNSADARQLAPRQVPGVSNARQVSLVGEGLGTTFLARTGDGQVYAWGGSQIAWFIDGVQTSTREPRRLPQAVTWDGEETPLANVTDIAGGSSNTGAGFALALKEGGSVWEWGDDKFYGARLTGIANNVTEYYALDGMPAPVAGLPPAQSIAVGFLDELGPSAVTFALVATTDGSVFAWDAANRTPAPVAGLSGIVAVSADHDGLATARGSDGSVWRWRYGQTPQQVSGLPSNVQLGADGADTVINGDCTDTTGSLWTLPPSVSPISLVHLVPRFGLNCEARTDFDMEITVLGQGRVLSEPAYVNCTQTCTVRVPAMTLLRLDFTPAAGWRKSDSSSASCASAVTMNSDRACSVEFELQPLPKTLAVFITGGGTVVSEPAGIDCPSDCTQNYSPNVQPPPNIGLAATALRGYQFTAFRGDEDCENGFVTMSVSRQCEAVFTPFPTPAAPAGFTAVPGNDLVNLTWTAPGNDSITQYTLQRAEGTGAFVAIAEIGGGATNYLDANVVPGREYTYRLTATNFSGSSPPATATAIVASPTSVTLTVQVNGPGRVVSSPAGIDCPGDCSQSYSLVTNVTLTATANANARFDGWGGSCSGTSPTAIVTTDDNRACSAQFSSSSAGGWVTLAAEIASSFELPLHSSVALTPTGLGFVAYLQAVDTQGPAGVQNRLNVRRINTGFQPLGLALNATANWNATSPGLVVDSTDTPIMIFCVDLSEIWVARWNGLTWSLLPPDPNTPAVARLNLTVATASRPRIVRSGNVLIAAWMENQRIAVRRYDLTTQQWDAGSFIPAPANPVDIDLAVDPNGLAVVAWTVGQLGTSLRATRETAPGTWVALGGEIGTRPQLAPMVQELGVHVDTANVVRIVWVEGDTNYFVQLAQFDGTNWVPAAGRSETRFHQGSEPVRTLSVNREPAQFAFAYAVDVANSADSFIVVQQLLNNSLLPVGSEFQTRHPEIRDLSFSMLQPHAATMAQSQLMPADPATHRLAVRRHFGQ